MKTHSSLLSLALAGSLLCAAPAQAQLTNLGNTAAATGHVSVVQGGAYSARHDVYLTVYESPTGIRGRFVNASGAAVGDVFAIAATGAQAILYANKPMVAYSHDTADDVFFVMYASDYNKTPDAQPSAWIQRVTFTGTGGARVGNPIQVGTLNWEIPNDLVYNPATRQFVAVWERFFSEGPDVMVRYFNADGTAATGVVNVTSANHGQGAAKAAVDWERNRILIAYQGLHPNSPSNPEILGLWAKIVDGTTGALLTGLLTAQNGFTIEPVPVFLPERDGFAVAWTGFNPGRDVQARFVSSANDSLGATPASVYTISGSSRQEGAPMGMYDAVSRRVLMAVQSSGGCPGDTCPRLDGAILDGQGAPLSAFTGLSTTTPTPTGGSFYPDVAVGEGGQFGVSYTLNYFGVYIDRVSLPAASTPGPVFGGGTVPTVTGVSTSPASVSFAVTKGGTTISTVTPQTISVSFSTGTAGSWSAASSVPWLQITGGSGSGNGSFTVTVINPSNVIGSQTSLSGNLVITAASATNSPLSVPVSLTVTPFTLAAMVPLGQVDSPAQNATGVQGAIGVTGWVIDDGAITSLQVFRNCLPADNPVSCQSVLGHSVVFLGNAAFLPGARPDVEAAFPLFPNSDRAGFGIQILSNQLPHINGQLSGGQGAITLYVVATDNVGNRKLLGRSADPASALFNTPTTLTLANDSIAKPFGTIDTPLLGATVSGHVANFGWALTPDSNTAAGAGDIVIPTDGSTMRVFIDGVERGTVAYNQCRGTVGNPPGPGVFCNDDVANQFGNATPAAPLTSRGSNPTLYRNLDATRSAIGAYVLDTRTLANGLHTIAWSVMDSAGRTEGIGSRFFTVSNGSSLQADAALSAAPSMARALASSIDGVPSGNENVWGRTGFDLRQSWNEMPLDGAGERHVRLDEMGRMELWLGLPVEAGYLVANGGLRDLPVGSSLEGAHFTWAPGPGQIGRYTLAFLRGGERIDVQVTIAPPVGAREGVAEVRMHLDSPVSGSVSGRTVSVHGWAFDPDAAIGSGIETVHVWARNTRTGATHFMGEGQVGGMRPDVAQAFGAKFNHSGFSLSAPLAAGDWEVIAYVWNRRTQRWEDARSATLTVR